MVIFTRAHATTVLCVRRHHFPNYRLQGDVFIKQIRRDVQTQRTDISMLIALVCVQILCSLGVPTATLGADSDRRN